MTWTLPWTNRVKAMQYLVATLGAGHSPGTSIGYRNASAVLVGRFRVVHDTGGGHRLATRPCRPSITLKLQPPAEATLCFILLHTTVPPPLTTRVRCGLALRVCSPGDLGSTAPSSIFDAKILVPVQFLSSSHLSTLPSLRSRARSHSP
jgi:hypothetical protein